MFVSWPLSRTSSGGLPLTRKSRSTKEPVQICKPTSSKGVSMWCCSTSKRSGCSRARSRSPSSSVPTESWSTEGLHADSLRFSVMRTSIVLRRSCCCPRVGCKPMCTSDKTVSREGKGAPCPFSSCSTKAGLSLIASATQPGYPAQCHARRFGVDPIMYKLAQSSEPHLPPTPQFAHYDTS
eukprot:scaffold2551_cov376-Prasinococcus_capsulatus_cf.AAC.11